MKLKVSNLLATTLVSGLIAGGAYAQENTAPAPAAPATAAPAAPAAAPAKKADAKQSKGQKEEKKTEKNGCGGKDGCGQMQTEPKK